MHKVLNAIVITYVIILVMLNIISTLIYPEFVRQDDSTFMFFALSAFIAAMFMFKSRISPARSKLSLDDVQLFAMAYNIFAMIFISYMVYLKYLEIPYDQTFWEMLMELFSRPIVSLFLFSTVFIQVQALSEHPQKIRLILFGVLAFVLLLVDNDEGIRSSSFGVIRVLPQLVYFSMLGVAHWPRYVLRG